MDDEGSSNSSNINIQIWSIMLRCLPESNTHPHLGNATYSRQDLILEIDSVLMCLYKWCKQEGDHQHNQHSYYTNRFPVTVKLLSVSGVREYSRQLCGGQGHQCIPHCIPFHLNPLSGYTVQSSCGGHYTIDSYYAGHQFKK